MYLGIVLIVIFVGCFASLMNNGLWSNTLTLINVLLAALIATSYFEPVADMFDKAEPSWTYTWDFIALWLLFIAAAVVLRMATDFLSGVKVKFFMPVDRVGGVLMAVWVGWIVMSFATMTLHTAPLARNFLGGAFQPNPNSRMLFGLAPDQVWLGWVHRVTGGSLSQFGTPAQFDPHGEFILKYGNRREEYEEILTFSKPSGK